MAFSQTSSDCSLPSASCLPFYNAWLTFNELRHKGVFCDVVLKVHDVRFPVHRLVLCACSDYFRSLFVGGCKTAEKKEIEIPGVTPEMMSSLLNFAYTGQVMVTSQNVEELLLAADQFLIKYVKDKCCSFLRHRLVPTNCIGIRHTARSYYCTRLIDETTTYILHNFEEIAQESEEFLHLPFDDFLRLITDDRLNVRLEESVCEAIFRWVKHDRNSRITHLYPLLKGVRMGLLDPEYFMSKVKANDLVKQCMPDCKNLIKEATELVCDLHSPGTHYIPSQETSFNSLLRPRLPTEVLLAIGGWSGGSPTNAIEAYDPRAETWLNVSTIPDSESPGGCKTVADIPRAYHGVAFVDGYVYVIGGFDGVSYFNTVRRFNVSSFEWVQEPSMLHKRCYISVAVLDNMIFALGGMNGESRLNTAECYDPDQRAWSMLPDMNEKRSDASASNLNGRIYIAGGFNGQECLFTAEFYDPQSSVWTRITPMRSRRSGVSIISYRGMIYSVGGFDGVNRLRHAEAYSPETNAWRDVPSMNKPRSNFGIEVIDDQLIVVGGYNGHQTTSNVEAYDDIAKEWYEVKDLNICRSALSCCVITSLSFNVIKRYCLPRDSHGDSEESLSPWQSYVDDGLVTMHSATSVDPSEEVLMDVMQSAANSNLANEED